MTDKDDKILYELAYKAIKDAWTEKLSEIDVADCIVAGVYESMPMAKDILKLMKDKSGTTQKR